MKLYWKTPPAKSKEDKIIRIILYMAVGIWLTWNLFKGKPSRHNGDLATRIIFHVFIATVWFYLALGELISLLRLCWTRRREQNLDAKGVPQREKPN
ncbi:MAG TPA: hypothetical protein VHY22_13900 [Chthoniobacteraceae bacterium]|nr:hypothetical protein [Chthoniobacteraceae bacterium]